MITNKNETLKVSEIYKSYQGEGSFANTPCIFLRLSTCNLHCTWCDTPYTWDWKNYDYNKETKVMKVDDVINKIIKLYNENNGISHLVITGGEPLLQEKQLTYLCHVLSHVFTNIEIETNGTIIPNHELVIYTSQFNVSPKMNNSGNDWNKLFDIYKINLKYFSKLNNVIFKFVIQNEFDINDMEIYFHNIIDFSKVWLMPEGRTKEEIETKYNILWQIGLEKGYRVTSRQHIIEYGNKRGV